MIQPPLSNLFHCVLWLLCAMLAATSVRAAEETSPTARYFEGLRERGLFELAENYGREQLRRDDLLPEERLELTLELSRTLAAHAVQTADENQQKQLWIEARGVLDRMIAQQPPQMLLLKLQAAQMEAMQGEALRYRVQLAPYDQVLREQAADILKHAVDELSHVANLVERELSGLSDTPESVTYSEAELKGLQVEVRQREAAARINLAMVLAGDSPERSVALLDATKLLQELLKRTGTLSRQRAAELQLLYARSLRLLRHDQQALDVLDQLPKPGAPSGIADRAAAERIRIFLAQANLPEAERVFASYSEAGRKLPGELTFLAVRLLSAKWEQFVDQNQTTAAEAQLALIQQRAGEARQTPGGYWGARAWALWEWNREAASIGADLSLAIRSARALYAHGKVIEAIEAYGDAAAAAFKDGQLNLAFDLAFTRGSLQLRSRQYDVAAIAFGELAEKFPDNRRAAEASLLRAYALGQVYQKRRSRSRREAYEQALEQHRQTFADHPTAASATWMLAQLEEQRLQTSVALKLYQSIPADHQRGQEARAAIARCYEKILARLRSLNQPEEAWRRQAVEELERFLPAEGSKLTETQFEIAVTLARIHLQAEQPDFAAADAALARVFQQFPAERSTQVSPQLKAILAKAMQLRVVSLAGQNRLQEAGDLLNKLSETSPDEMLQILNGLAQLVELADNDVRKELGVLQLQAVEALERRRDELSASQARRLDECHAQAYIATDQIDEAVSLYSQLQKRFPKDRELPLNLGRVLVQCGTKSCLTRAQKIWRAVEAKQRAGQPDWLEARYYRALINFETGEYDTCHKLLGVTAQLYPELGGHELKAKFEALQAKCDAARE